MNQNFTVQKQQYLSEKKNSCKLKIPHPPVTFLMVRPLRGESGHLFTRLNNNALPTIFYLSKAVAFFSHTNVNHHMKMGQKYFQRFEKPPVSPVCSHQIFTVFRIHKCKQLGML